MFKISLHLNLTNFYIITILFYHVLCCAKSLQLCLTLFDHMDYTVHGILQARILEWVAIPLSRGSFQHRDQTCVSHIAGIFFTS